MWPDRRFIDLVGIEHPIIQAPMAGSCTPALAAAVGSAGGLGSLGVGPRPADFARERVEALRSASNRPFNLNFFAHRPPEADAEELAAAHASLSDDYAALGLGVPPEVALTGGPGFGAEQLELLLELRPAVASFHLGLPEAKAISTLRDAGIILGATATTVAEACKVEAAGCHFIVAQGFEAGGHRGAHEHTAPDQGIGGLALIPQVVDAVTIPVLAAGGIGDARGIVAALALGAAGVQMGTAFLRCPEAETDAPRRARLAEARESDTSVTTLISGRANRAALGPKARRLNDSATRELPYPLQYGLSGPLMDADEAGYGAMQYGQSARLARELPAAQLVESLVAETAARMKSLTANLGERAG